MYRRYEKVLVSVVVLAVCLALTGCGGQISKANFDKITNGMSEQEVEGILGKPTESQEIDPGAALKGMGDVVGGMMGGKDKMKLPDMPKTEKIKQCIWKSGNKAITVQFMGGKVVQKGALGL